MDPSFRERVISSIGEGIADEPETVSVGGKEGYLFHINKYPSYVFGQDVIVVFYEDQIVQIAGPDERLTKLYAAEVVNSLPWWNARRGSLEPRRDDRPTVAR